MTRAAALLIAAVVLSAADEKKHKPELPPEVQSIVDLSRGTAPEFFVKTIADLVEKGAISGREARIDLLEEAFAVARSAKEPYRLVAIRITPPDTRELHRSMAAALKLDALSLEAQIVKETIRIDSVKARAMFDAIPRPVLDPRPCEDALVPDVSAYYEMAAAIAQSTFTAEQKDKDQHVRFLEAMLDSAKSPGELLPFLQTSKTIRLSRAQREALIGAFAAKMQSIEVDQRAFAMNYEDLKAEVDGLDAAERNVIAPVLRSYEIAQASGARCATFGPTIYGDGGEEIRSASAEGAAKFVEYAASPGFRRIFAKFGDLKNTSITDPDWRTRLDDFLRELNSWNPQEADIDRFHQKATVLRALLDAVPAGDDRDRLLAMCVDFLSSSPQQQENPEPWLYQVEMLDRDPKMRDLFRASGSPALFLYANYFSGSNGTSK